MFQFLIIDAVWKKEKLNVFLTHNGWKFYYKELISLIHKEFLKKLKSFWKMEEKYK